MTLTLQWDAAMTNFWNLPKLVREKIYRMHLVRDAPVDYEKFIDLCGVTDADWRFRGMKLQPEPMLPRILHVSQEMEEEGKYDRRCPVC